MSGKPVIPRERARLDVENAVEYYLTQAGTTVALGLVDEMERAYRHIAQHPDTGTPRYAHELGLPGLRAWPVRRFPYLVFYIGRGDRVDVWRVLHNERDIPARMQAPAEE